MDTSFFTFFFGLLGGVFAELLGHFRMRTSAPGELPSYLQHWYYWLVTFGMIVAGGVLAFAYVKSGMLLPPLIAINVGASAPLIIGNLTAKPAVIPEKN